jgi:flagellar protein FliO/FliZ
MMSTRAPACPPATQYEAAAQVPHPVRLSARLRKGGANALLASLFLIPLAACAVQPAVTGAAPAATPAAAQPAPQASATAPRQQDGNSAAPGPQDSGSAPQAQAPAAPAAPAASAPASSPTTTPAPSTTTASGTPAAERATTVGEVPTVAAATPSPAPGAAAVPGGPPANPATPAPMVQAAPGPSTGTLLQTILALVLVLALLAGLAWAAKRYAPRMAGNPANLRMVGALNIGGRERIMVVEVGDQWIVVGASPGRVNALATMPKGDAASIATLAGHTPSASSFSDWLKQTIDKRNAK